MSDWSVSLPRNIVKQLEKEVTSQNINLQTAVIEALELWLNTPTSNSRKIKEVEQNDIEEVNIKEFKQCFIVDRDCTMENCQAWFNDSCAIITSLAPHTIPPDPKRITSDTRISDFFNNDFIIPNEGIDLNEIMDNIERNILKQALTKTKGYKKEAAGLLNISFDSLRHRIDKLGISFDHINTNNNVKK